MGGDAVADHRGLTPRADFDAGFGGIGGDTLDDGGAFYEEGVEAVIDRVDLGAELGEGLGGGIIWHVAGVDTAS
jgi:hypothetical protein